MASQGVGGDVKGLGGPSERESGRMELGVRYDFLVEVSFAEDQEVARRVVVRRSVTRDLWRAQFVDVAVTVDADVIGDVDPSLLVLVVALILAEATRGVAVVAEDDGLVVQGHASDGVRLAAGSGGTSAPGIATQHDS